MARNNSHSRRENEGPGRELFPGVRRDRNAAWTLNATPGETVYGESIRKYGPRHSPIEWRRWDPTRSKIGAGLIRTRFDSEDLLPLRGSQALYLGAAHGTTVSHLHDFMCGQDNHKGGRIVAVDLSPRCLRDLTHLARKRPGLVPVLGDARKFDAWGMLVPTKVDWLFQDVSQSHQVGIFIAAAQRFLAYDGVALLSLKAESEQRNEQGQAALFDSVADQLEQAGFEIVERIVLHGLEDHHELFHAIYLPD